MKKGLWIFILLLFSFGVTLDGYASPAVQIDDKNIWNIFKENNDLPSCKIGDEFSCFSDLDPDVFQSQVEPGTLISFRATDVDGNPVNSEDIFPRQKVTMVKIWSVTCSHCISEMPELVKLNKEFEKEGAQIIGIIYDADEDDEIDEAREIIEALGVDFVNLLPNTAIWTLFKTQSFPSTFFVNNHGELLDKPVMGAKTGMYPELISKYLSQISD